MPEFAKEIIPIAIENELKQSYLDYAMSVIIGRALPDVRDGLKPVHRRVLFAMHELSNDWNKPYKKSARIVGDVIGKYHPHGDTAVYDTIVRMAQPFSLRYMLVDGQGNFGSVDGDAPAAMRYTEVRLSKIAHEFLNDLEKDTVDFAPNYDGTEFVPVVLPARIPNLLVNGSAGIAVGMATNVPPHNLTEVINACVAMVDSPEISLNELMKYIPGPDFPTAAIISGKSGILEAYKTGRGRIVLRARTTVETSSTGKQSIIINELPYQVNKAKLLEKIGELIRHKKIDSISALRDESDKRGMRAVIELRRGENAEVVLNNLYAHTQMQNVFGINMVALDNGQPRVFNLREILEAFIQHRRNVVTRRTVFELKKARNRAHVLEGLAIALSNIDAIVTLIRAVKTSLEAKQKLMAQVWRAGSMHEILSRTGADSKPEDLEVGFGMIENGYRLTDIQAQSILDMRLHRLTGLEQDKILDEYKKLLLIITDLLDILVNPEKLMAVIREELLYIKEQFGDERRTEIIGAQKELCYEDLIPEEAVVVTISHQGYAKMQPMSDYAAQHRGGKGKSIARVKEEDFVEHLVIANTHETILCFTNKGKVYWMKVYLMPQGGRAARGKPLVNLLPFAEDERVSAILPMRDFHANNFVLMATAFGTVKKVAVERFSRQRPSGLIAVDLKVGDDLIDAVITTGDQDVMLFTDAGKAIRFNETQVRAMGRVARGVRGIKLPKGHRVVSLIAARRDGEILTATENGFGKRTPVGDYPCINRGGRGVIAIKVSERNGKVIGALQAMEDNEIMLISDRGTLVRTRINEISVVSRNTQGVCLIKLAAEEKLIAIQRVVEDNVY